MKIVEEQGRREVRISHLSEKCSSVRDGWAGARSRGGEERVLQAEGTACTKTWQGSRSLLLPVGERKFREAGMSCMGVSGQVKLG